MHAGSEVLDGFLQPITQAMSRLKSEELLGPAHVKTAPGLAVRLGRVPVDAAVEAGVRAVAAALATEEVHLVGTAGVLAEHGDLVGGPVRKMVLAGTSMTAGVLINYLPAHMVYRTPQMQRIFDGFAARAE